MECYSGIDADGLSQIQFYGELMPGYGLMMEQIPKKLLNEFHRAAFDSLMTPTQALTQLLGRYIDEHRGTDRK